MLPSPTHDPLVALGLPPWSPVPQLEQAWGQHVPLAALNRSPASWLSLRESWNARRRGQRWRRGEQGSWRAAWRSHAALAPNPWQPWGRGCLHGDGEVLPWERQGLPLGWSLGLQARGRGMPARRQHILDPVLCCPPPAPGCPSSTPAE